MRKKYLLYDIMVFKQVNLDFNEHIRYAFQKKNFEIILNKVIVIIQILNLYLIRYYAGREKE